MMDLLKRARLHAEYFESKGMPPDIDMFLDVIVVSYVAGATKEIAPFIYWNEGPRMNTPANSQRVLVRVMLPNGEVLVTGGWYGTAPGEQGWNIDISDRFPDLKVVAWRPIMGIEK